MRHKSVIFVGMEELQKELEDLRGQLSGDMMADMVLRDRIHQIEMELNGVSPSCGLDGSECENCSG